MTELSYRNRRIYIPVYIFPLLLTQIDTDGRIKELTEVEMDIEDALFNGIYAIPHFIISIDNHNLIVPGAFEKDAFKVAIEDMMSGEIKNKTFI